MGELDCIIFQMVENVLFLALICRYNSIKQQFFLCIYKKRFHEDGFDAVISCYKDQTTFQLDLHYILLFDYIITAE